MWNLSKFSTERIITWYSVIDIQVDQITAINSVDSRKAPRSCLKSQFDTLLQGKNNNKLRTKSVIDM